MYYSTNHSAARATLREAVVRGLAEDRGLYMPETIKQLPASFWDEMADLSFQEIAYRVADAFFGDDVPADDLRRIVFDTLSFDTPVVEVEPRIYALELFHGPTLAFKDVGARFMARLLQWICPKGCPSPNPSPVREGDKVTVSAAQSPLPNRGSEGESGLTECQAVLSDRSRTPLLRTDKVGGGAVNVLVATSGDTGSAVANGFLGVDGIHVYVLYPKGKVSAIQECQFTTLGRNITALEVDGNFDDCQRLVKSAFMDGELNAHMRLTSANSINVARFLPQAFYYFWAYAQLSSKLSTLNSQLVVCVPSGNFGNLCAGLFGHVMGLPVKRFIASNNANRVFYDYLLTGKYTPRPSIQTIANAMDVGDPSNFARIQDLYSREDVQEIILQRNAAQQNGTEPLISGATYTDDQIAATMRDCYARTGYVLDPHGACGYQALRDQLKSDEIGIFLETAHPAKFKQTVDNILGTDIAIPERLQAFMRGQKQSVQMSKDFTDFKAYLLQQ